MLPESEVFVKVVKSIDEISEVSSQNPHDAIITIFAHIIYKRDPTEFHEFIKPSLRHLCSRCKNRIRIEIQKSFQYILRLERTRSDIEIVISAHKNHMRRGSNAVVKFQSD